MHWNIIFGIFVVLSACGDFVEESDTSACNSAIDARNYDKALSVCTSRKDKASAYLGKAGYDIINLIKSSGTPVIKFTKPTALGTDDIAGASILNILQLSEAAIPDDDARAIDIANSKTNLDEASALLQPYLNDNSQPLSTDEILLNTFAISFAMQLHQLEIFDNETTSGPIPTGSVNSLKCEDVEGADGALASAKLIAMDGHLWSTERNGMMCNRIKNAVNSLDNDTAEGAVVDAKYMAGNKLHGDIFNTVCTPLDSLTTYLTDLTDNIAKLSLSGDNTKAITNAKTSTNTLLETVGCKE